MRENKIEKYKTVWISEEVYDILRKKKKELVNKKRGKSMMRIVNDLVINYLK